MPALRVRFERLSEAESYQADIQVSCRGCRRQLLFDRATFLAILKHKGLSDLRARVAGRMRCFECYARGATLAFAPQSPSAIRLNTGDPLPPRGVSITEWCGAGGQERRRRLIRQARD